MSIEHNRAIPKEIQSDALSNQSGDQIETKKQTPSLDELLVNEKLQNEITD